MVKTNKLIATIKNNASIYIWKIIYALSIFFLFSLSATFIQMKIVSYFTSKTNKQIILYELISNLIKYFIIFIGFMIGLIYLGFEISSIIIIFTSIGLAFALAAQDTIKQLFSGIIIVLFNFFDKGDLIETNEITGLVKDFNLFNTAIENIADKTIIIIPNNNIYPGILKNFNKNEIIKLDIQVNISNSENKLNYEDLIKELNTEIQNNNQFLIPGEDISIHVLDMKREGTVLKVSIPIKSEKYLEAKGGTNTFVRNFFAKKEIKLLDYMY
jgi:MscS family membrane protein